MKLLAALAVSISLLAAPAYSHESWINWGGYKNADGVRCCGVGDCHELSAEQVKVTPRGYVLTNGELVPFSEAQASEDGKYWRCQKDDGSRRCFFAPQPGS